MIQLTSVTDGRTDRQTDGRPDDGKDARSILLSRVKREGGDVFQSDEFRAGVVTDHQLASCDTPSTPTHGNATDLVRCDDALKLV